MEDEKGSVAQYDLENELDVVEQGLDAFFHRRMVFWRIRTLLTAILVGIIYFFYPALWWLWLIPAISLLAMGFMYWSTKKRIAKMRAKIQKY